MIDPGTALLVFVVMTVAVSIVLWPRHGVVARVRRLRRLDERVRIEDALKHAYMCERQGAHCTLESLAGRLEVSTGEAAAILGELARLALVRVDGPEPVLTEEGRRSALQIVRTHRLWERWLADRTGVPPGEWHDRAERMEHTLTAAETDALESRLGHPRWDPHGDPIPTAEGEIPPRRGVSLAGLEAGETVEVLHVEDEPRAIFDELLRHGVSPGDRLEVMARTEDELRLRSEEGEWSLAAVSARNVTVRRLPLGERAPTPRRTLLDAKPGERVRVAGIAPVCQGAQRRRLLDLGVVRGTEIVPELVSMSGDPVAYRVRGALIALRSEQAAWITVEPGGADAEEVA